MITNLLYLKCKCEFRTDSGIDFKLVNADKNYDFNVPHEAHRVFVRIENGKYIQAIQKIDNPDQIKKLKQILESRKADINGIYATIREAIYKLVRLLKEELVWVDLSDNLIKNEHYFWSLDGINWTETVIRKQGYVSVFGQGILHSKTVKVIQEMLDIGVTPLVAIDYLHHARKTPSNKYKWIYATVAAELATKEVLILINPKLKTLLGEIQSPRLDLLYGSVLEDLTGHKHPKTNELGKGASIRNKLIHNPKHPQPTTEKTIKYVSFVETTVKWLLAILHNRQYSEKGIDVRFDSAFFYRCLKEGSIPATPLTGYLSGKNKKD